MTLINVLNQLYNFILSINHRINNLLKLRWLIVIDLELIKDMKL